MKSKSWLISLWERIGIAGVAATLSLLLFARFSAEFGETGGGLPQFDHDVLRYLRDTRIDALFRFAYAISWTFRPGGQIAFALLAAALFWWRKEKRVAIVVAGATIGGAGVMMLLKTIGGRPRPEEIFAPLGYSFPSGHTFMAVTILGVPAYFLAQASPAPRRVWVWAGAVILMFLVGWSRLYLGEHFPSDVGAGYASAFCWVYICLSFSRYLPTLRQTKPR